MNKMLLPESLLKEAVIRACERENAALDKLVAEAEDPVFSSDFKKNIKKLTKEMNNVKKADIVEYPLKRVPKKSLRIKIAMIAIIVMMFGSMTVMAVEPWREKAYEIVETLFSDHTDISFEEVSEENAEDDTDSQIKSFNPADFPKKLKWVPEGFELYDSLEVDTSFLLMQLFVSSNPQKDWQQIEYQQTTMENSSGWSFTSDGTPAKEIEIGSEKGYLYTDEGGYLSIIVKKDGFAYYIGGNVDIDILTKCLELTLENDKTTNSSQNE